MSANIDKELLRGEIRKIIDFADNIITDEHKDHWRYQCCEDAYKRLGAVRIALEELVK